MSFKVGSLVRTVGKDGSIWFGTVIAREGNVATVKYNELKAPRRVSIFALRPAY
jgi:hypothetical protein